MQKIFLAIGHRQVEDFLEKNMKNEFNFVGTTVYREGILKGIAQSIPDILIVRETLEGSTNIMDVIYQVRTSYPDIRIVFIAGKREPGDALLSTLVSYGIYDILTGEKINVGDIIRVVKEPNKFADVMYLQPKTKIDERTNKKIFEAPTPIVEKVYIEKTVQVKEPIEEYAINEKVNNVKSSTSTTVDVKGEKVKNNSTNKINYEKSNKVPIKEVNEPKRVEEKRPFLGGRNRVPEDNFATKSTKQQILTFVGSSPGIGTTQIAFNTAIKLAQRGFKTMFIDLNDRGSTVSYTYQIGDYYNGIDTALKGIAVGDYSKIDDSIITTKGILKNTPKDNLMLKNYKKFPENLDFLFFSQEYWINKKFLKEDINHEYLKDLLMYLSFQKEYDFIILDTKADIYNKLTEVAIAYSTKIFSIITQDVNSISLNITQLSEFNKKRINLKDKLYYILNKYENAILDSKDIEDWISDNVDFRANINIFIPNVNKDFIESNYLGLPILLISKNRDFLKAFYEIEKTIL